MDGHESSTKTGFFSLHQRLAFPYVWATIIHGTGVPVPPLQDHLLGGEEMMPQEQNGKAVTQ